MTLAALAADLAAGRTTAAALAEQALDAIADPAGEGARTFVSVQADAARAAAAASDRLRASGMVPSPLAGIPISVKDLFDIAGLPTTAGSVALADAPPAAADAPVVARLRASGAVIPGRTNMTEFAFSGIGLNPHYGTPRNPWDRATGRIPGGSSSGAAVSVTDGMAAAGIGTDTGGSVRIPAALCGLTGFKPTARRVPRDGVVPLSASLDSIGPLAPSVACCALLDAVIAGEPPRPLRPPVLAGLRLAVPQTVVLDDMDAAVAAAFARALDRLSAAGVLILERRMPVFAEVLQATGRGGLVAAEAYAWHRSLLARAADRYDPWVLTRIRRAEQQSAADYVDVLNARTSLIAQADQATREVDAVVMPTVPTVAPTIAACSDADGFTRHNLLMLRNTSLGNFLDRCAISLPCHRPGEAPVGLMLMGETGADHALLDLAAAVEAVLA